MKIDFDLRKLTDQLVKLELATALPEIAEKVKGETLGHAIIGAQTNIYLTAPGEYERTGDYLRGLRTAAKATRHTVSVTVQNDETYAVYVEAGRDGLSLAMLHHLAGMQQDPSKPFTLGRSGQKWIIPGPVVTGAQFFALHRMKQLFAEKVRAVKP